jgi:four helix bundle protein
MDVNDLDVYRRSMRLAEEIWADVEDWPSFAKYSIGTQITQAADSIAANISEGHGRYHFGENRQFCYYARGSLQETRTWLQKARSRRLISKDRFDELSTELVEIRKMLNGYINSIGRQGTNSKPSNE